MSHRMPSHCPAISENRVDHCLPERGLKGVELENIRPCREVWVPAAGEHLAFHLDEGGRGVAHVVSTPLNEVLGMIADPGIVRRDVIGNEVEDQAQPALSEMAPRGGESLGSAEMFVNDVAAHAVRRADIVCGEKSGRAFLKSWRSPSFRMEMPIPAGLRSQTPMNHTASKP